MAAALDGTRVSSPDVRYLDRFVKRTARLLGLPKASSRQVARTLDRLVAQLRQAIDRHAGSNRALALRHMVKTTEIFGSKLFTHYDHPEIPRTDNGLEGLFGLARRHERVITGHKSTARRTVRDGPFLVVALQRGRHGLPSLEELGVVPEKRWRQTLAEIREARSRYDRPRRIRAGLKTLLGELVQQCRRLPKARSRAP